MGGRKEDNEKALYHKDWTKRVPRWENKDANHVDQEPIPWQLDFSRLHWPELKPEGLLLVLAQHPQFETMGWGKKRLRASPRITNHRLCAHCGGNTAIWMEWIPFRWDTPGNSLERDFVVWLSKFDKTSMTVSQDRMSCRIQCFWYGKAFNHLGIAYEKEALSVIRWLLSR